MGVFALGLLAALGWADRTAFSMPAERILDCFAAPISVLSWPNGTVELTDANDSSRYSTDADVESGKLSQGSRGELHYTNERGYSIAIGADGSRMVWMPDFGLTVIEGEVEGGGCEVSEFTLPETVLLNGDTISGSWKRNSSGSRIWSGQRISTTRPPVSLGTLEGDFRLTDFALGEVQLTDDARHFRVTLRRDGYQRFEDLDARDGTIRQAVERFAGGRKIRRELLAEDALRRIGLAPADGVSFFEVEITRPGASSPAYALVEAESAEGTRVAAYKAADGWMIRSTDLGQEQLWTGPGSKFWGDYLRIGPDGVRIRDKANDQIVTELADGSRMLVLLLWRTRLREDNSISVESVPRYTITRNAGGSAVIVDGEDGRVYRSGALDADRRIRIEGDDLTFTDRKGSTITIRADGSRTINVATGARMEIDKGGRLLSAAGAGGTTSTEYRYASTGTSFVLSEFNDSEGRWWTLTGEVDGKQRWRLANPVDGNSLSLRADRVYLEGEYTVVQVDGIETRAATTAGTHVKTTDTLVGWPLIREKTIVVSDDAGKEAYRLVTRDRNGEPLEEELVTLRSHLVRAPDGFWSEVDADGKPKPETAFAGSFRIDNSGTLIRRSFVTEPDPEKPGALRIKMQSDGTGYSWPVVERDTFVFENGETEDRFPDGAEIRRAFDGTVISIRYPGDRERMAFDISDSRIGSFTEGLESWVFSPAHAVFFPNEGDALYFRRFLASFNLDHAEARVAFKDFGSGGPSVDRRVERFADGAIDLTETYEATDTLKVRAVTDAGGRLTLFEGENGTAYRLAYAPDGTLARADVGDDLVVVDVDYEAPLDHPLPAENVIRASSLQFRGAGNDKYLSYVSEAGYRVNAWADGAREEYDRDDPAKVIRTDAAGVPTAVRDGYLRPGEKPEPGRLFVVADIKPWRGTGPDKLAVITTADGDRIEQYADGSSRFYDAAGRLQLTSSRDGQTVTFIYPTDDRSPSDLFSTYWIVDRSSGSALWQGTGLRPWEPRRVRDIDTDDAGNTRIAFADADPVFMQFEARGGGYALMRGNGTVEHYDRLERLDRVQSPWGFAIRLFYAGEEAAPVRIVTAEQTWLRQGPPADAADAYEWRDEKSGETIRRSVFSDSGDYAFGFAADAPEAVPGEPAANVEVERDTDGRLLGLTRTAIDGQGQPAVTRRITSRDGGWYDDHDNRFDNFWMDERTGSALLASRDWKTLRILTVAGRETELKFDRDFELLSRVDHDGLGGLGPTYDAHGNTTRILLDGSGALEGVMQGVSLITRTPAPDEYRIGTYWLQPVFATLQIADDGRQMWRGRVERRVHPDGLIEIVRPDGSRSYRCQDATSDRHVFGPGNEVQELVVRPSGQVEATLDDGTMWRNEIYSDVIQILDSDGYPVLDADGRPRTLAGKLRVGPHGNLTYDSAASGDVTVFHAGGETTRFEALGGGGWADTASGRVYETRTELAERFREIDAAMARTENDHDMSLRTNPAFIGTIAIGMDELTTRSLEPVVEADGLRRWHLGAGSELHEKDGALTLRHDAPGSTMTARPGDDSEWAAMRAALVELTSREYAIAAENMPFKLKAREFDPGDVERWLERLGAGLRK